MDGGASGEPWRQFVERVCGRHESLGSQAEIMIEAGDRIIIETPGGGGWGKQ